MENICYFNLELSMTMTPTKTRKRTRKVLHPIATDCVVDEEVTCPSITEVGASPARRPRLLDPRELEKGRQPVQKMH